MKKDNTKKPFIKTKKKLDNSVEVVLQKSPAKTTIGKVLLYLVVVGTILLPVAVLIYVLLTK